MIIKLSIKIILIALEIFLGFYTLAISDSLIIKFSFFVVIAVLIAFAITKLISILLPADKDDIPKKQQEEEN